MSTPEHMVVVGDGAAAGNAVVSLREAGWDGCRTVLAAEPQPALRAADAVHGRPSLRRRSRLGTREARQQPISDPAETHRWGVSRQRLADPGRALDDVWL